MSVCGSVAGTRECLSQRHFFEEIDVHHVPVRLQVLEADAPLLLRGRQRLSAAPEDIATPCERRDGL